VFSTLLTRRSPRTYANINASSNNTAWVTRPLSKAIAPNHPTYVSPPVSTRSSATHGERGSHSARTGHTMIVSNANDIPKALPQNNNGQFWVAGALLSLGRQITVIEQPAMKFALYPIERVAFGQQRGGWEDWDFDPALLPFEIMDRIHIEDVSARFLNDEFDVHENGLGSYAVKELKRIKYAIVHRFPQYELDPVTNKIILDAEQVERAQRLVREIFVCLLIIRPILQRAQFCEGHIRDDGTFIHGSFDVPNPYADVPYNQRLFSIRTEDIQSLKFYAPLFINVLHQPFWKFRMAAQLYEAGHWQSTDKKIRFFLWVSALEALFTTQGSGTQHSGKLVAGERIKALIGGNTPIYSPGELASSQQNPGITVSDVIGDIYCLRNHIAHGDKLPDYYWAHTGRPFDNEHLTKFDELIEAVSFILRRCLLTILKDELLPHFADKASSEAYFTGLGQTKKQLKNAGAVEPKCPA
jgi:hypothetical protein